MAGVNNRAPSALLAPELAAPPDPPEVGQAVHVDEDAELLDIAEFLASTVRVTIRLGQTKLWVDVKNHWKPDEAARIGLRIRSLLKRAGQGRAGDDESEEAFAERNAAAEAEMYGLFDQLLAGWSLTYRKDPLPIDRDSYALVPNTVQGAILVACLSALGRQAPFELSYTDGSGPTEPSVRSQAGTSSSKRRNGRVSRRGH